IAGSTLPHPRPTSSSSGWRPSITARLFSSCPSDSASRRTPCPPGTARGGFRSALAVSDFRLCARLGFSIPSSSQPARSYPRLWIQRPPFERRRDLNPPESRAAQRTVGFVHPPGTVGGLQFAAAPPVELRRVPLYPPPNGRVVHREAALGHKFLDVTIRKGIAQVPSDRTYDDHGFEVSPFE